MTREEIEHLASFEPCSYMSESEIWYNKGLLEGLKTADANPKSHWISVNDDLPCNHKELIYSKNKEQTVGVLACIHETKTVYFTGMKMVDGKWEWEEIVTPDYNYGIPTHWMPIPELPKE